MSIFGFTGLETRLERAQQQAAELQTELKAANEQANRLLADIRAEAAAQADWILFDEQGKALVGYWREGERVFVRPATSADWTACRDGRLHYDSERCPCSKAWAKHVANGGD